MESKQWYQSKTLWVSIFGALYGLARFVAGEIDLNTLVEILLIAGSAFGIRKALN